MEARRGVEPRLSGWKPGTSPPMLARHESWWPLGSCTLPEEPLEILRNALPPVFVVWWIALREELVAAVLADERHWKRWVRCSSVMGPAPLPPRAFPAFPMSSAGHHGVSQEAPRTLQIRALLRELSDQWESGRGRWYRATRRLPLFFFDGGFTGH